MRSEVARSKTGRLPAYMFFVVALILFVQERVVKGLFAAYGGNESEMMMKMVVTFGFGSVALIILLTNRFEPKHKPWASATLGMILGYWLKT